MQFAKTQPFIEEIDGHDAEFFSTLGVVLAGTPGPIHNWMTDNLPYAISWREEIMSAASFTQTPELAALPKIKEVLMFLARIKNAKPALDQSSPPAPGSGPDLSSAAELDAFKKAPA